MGSESPPDHQHRLPPCRREAHLSLHTPGKSTHRSLHHSIWVPQSPSSSVTPQPEAPTTAQCPPTSAKHVRIPCWACPSTPQRQRSRPCTASWSSSIIQIGTRSL